MLHAVADCTPGTPIVSRITKVLANILAGIRNGSEMQARYIELSRLSDAGLAIRGLTRDEITLAVVRGRSGD
jgi:hypothetical protein